MTVPEPPYCQCHTYEIKDGVRHQSSRLQCGSPITAGDWLCNYCRESHHSIVPLSKEGQLHDRLHWETSPASQDG